MAVKIYQNEELNDVMFQIESLEEWKSITADLGLEGQSQLVTRAESPVPYPFINESMKRIFKTLCPASIDFKQFSQTPIPLEVLRQIQYSVKERHFQTIEIWYDDKSPDPFVVGSIRKYYVYDKKYNRLKDDKKEDVLFDSPEEGKAYADAVGFEYYSSSISSDNKYLIGRWGDEIRPLEELKSIAKERLIEKYGSEIKNQIENLSQALKKINENAILYLTGDISEGKLNGTSSF